MGGGITITINAESNWVEANFKKEVLQIVQVTAYQKIDTLETEGKVEDSKWHGFIQMGRVLELS
jgi:hypothetical protein